MLLCYFGTYTLVDAYSLGEIFHKRGVQLAVLNTCHSADAPQGDLSVADALVKAGVPAVVGMKRQINDQSAMRFSYVLYQRLASGYSVGDAVEEACKTIDYDSRLKGLDADVPVARGNSNLKIRLDPGTPGVFDNYPVNNLEKRVFFWQI